MTEAKDQVAGAKAEGQSQEEKVLSLDEQFDRGWEQVDLLTEQEQAAKAKPKEEAKPAEKKEAADVSAKPFKVLKVGGKDVPVATEDDYNALAMKGLDYTKKTQALADDRRGAETEIKSKTEALEAQATRMETLLDRLVAAGYVPEKVAAQKKASAAAAGTEAETSDTVSDDELAVYKEFQIDPANAYPHEKNMAKRLAELSKDVQQFKTERMETILQKAIDEERENFPFDDIKDDQGTDLTRKQFRTILRQKRDDSGIEKPTIEQATTWAREAVRELHDLQRKSAPSGISDDMDPAEFAKKFPKLASSLKGSPPAAAAKAEDAQAADKVPPTIKPTARPSDLTRRMPVDKGARKSYDDYLDEGFKDPETLKALGISGG